MRMKAQICTHGAMRDLSLVSSARSCPHIQRTDAVTVNTLGQSRVSSAKTPQQTANWTNRNRPAVRQQHSESIGAPVSPPVGELHVRPRAALVEEALSFVSRRRETIASHGDPM